MAFGGIALFVGAFIIFNTLSITVAQRAREFGLLRMIGASRRQILRSVLLEAAAIGLLASVIGMGLGFLLAKGLQALFKAFGIDLPSAGTVFETRTLIVALAIGLGVTVVAGLVPAIRATRIPPVAALREGIPAAAAKQSRASILIGGAGDAPRHRPALLRHLRLGHHRGRPAEHDGRGLPAPVHRSGGVLAAHRPAAAPGCSAGRRRASSALQASSRATTRCGTRAGPRPPRPR